MKEDTPVKILPTLKRITGSINNFMFINLTTCMKYTNSLKDTNYQRTALYILRKLNL